MINETEMLFLSKMVTWVLSKTENKWEKYNDTDKKIMKEYCIKLKEFYKMFEEIKPVIDFWSDLDIQDKEEVINNEMKAKIKMGEFN